MAFNTDAETDTLMAQATLLGIPTPLGNVMLPADIAGSTLAIATVCLGTLAADTAAGAIVRGSGTAMLWISGTASEVNVKLDALTYTGGALGSDTLSVTYVDAAGDVTNSAQTPVTVVSLSSGTNGTQPRVEIDCGTLTLDTRLIDGPALAFSEEAGSQTATTGILINTTIGTHSTLSVRNNNGIGGTVPRLAIAGRVELDGTANLTGSSTAVLLAKGSSLVNEGSMTIGPQAAQFSGADTLVNDGSITIDGSLDDSTGPSTVRIDTVVTGSGQITLTAGASMILNGAVTSAETVRFGTGANTLHLLQPGAFAGRIAGFSHGDTIVLDGATITSASVRVSADAGSSTVSLFDGTAAIGSIRFDTREAGSLFELGTDMAGNTVVRLATVTALPPNSGAADVFRFFDTAHGTQLLTQNRMERDAILADRPDLQFEGIAFKAVDPAASDPATADVFRFFDTRNGTHFMTASTGERDALISSRSDLVFEPGSTMLEHATAQTGDVAVYRFFDGTSGAHFFTADAGERAGILATRPDMTLEGIAFYAPAH